MIQQNTSTAAQNQAGGIQIVQQIVTANGEIQQIPVRVVNYILENENKTKFMILDSTITSATSDDTDAIAK